MEQATTSPYTWPNLRGLFSRSSDGKAHRSVTATWRAALALIAGAVCIGACASSPPHVEHTIYLVRHAEKADGDNPSLTLVGRTRAELLANELRDAGLSVVYATNYNRTQETASVTARQAGLPVFEYDPQNLETFALMLRATPGNILVVGHSNTTTRMVDLLGGKPGDPIAETEYDRLYILTAKGHRVKTDLRKYGK